MDSATAAGDQGVTGPGPLGADRVVYGDCAFTRLPVLRWIAIMLSSSSLPLSAVSIMLLTVVGSSCWRSADHLPLLPSTTLIPVYIHCQRVAASRSRLRIDHIIFSSDAIKRHVRLARTEKAYYTMFGGRHTVLASGLTVAGAIPPRLTRLPYHLSHRHDRFGHVMLAFSDAGARDHRRCQPIAT